MAKRPSKLAVAWTAGRLAGRRLLRRSVGDADLELGDHLAAQLDEMKGLAMKMGQIVSYMEIPLPDAVQDRLARLQTGQRGMPADAVRQAIEASMGAALEQCFSTFELEPVAAASIGQVHRARVDDQPVAVKIQYPDVASSFDNDLRGVSRLASLASLASAVDGQAIARELGERLAEECDYLREAQMQAAFAAAFADDPTIAIPEVVTSHCRANLLTTRWVDGIDFARLRDEGSEELRNAIAQTLVRFSYRSLLVLGAIQADPHPGNFLFGDDERVTFLDFGCVRTFEPDFVLALRQLIVAVRDQSPAAARQAADALGLVGRPRKFDDAHFFAMVEHLHRPLLHDGFTFERSYMHEAVAFNGPTNPNARAMAIPPAYMWVSRLQWGLWAILTKLGVRGSFAAITEQLLEQPIALLQP